MTRLTIRRDLVELPAPELDKRAAQAFDLVKRCAKALKSLPMDAPMGDFVDAYEAYARAHRDWCHVAVALKLSGGAS